MSLPIGASSANHRFVFETLSLSEMPDGTQALRRKVRALIARQVAQRPADQRARSWMGWDRDFTRALAAEGLVGLTLPTEYGGGGLGPFERFAVVEELLAAGAPVAAHWIADRQSAPLILKFGTEEQRRRYVPAICRGDALFCIGMSEPGSGSDLAGVRTRAERTDEGGWRLNGQKIWTTGARHADYMIALVRTSGSAEDRHAGLSQLIVDLSLPGVTVRLITDLTGDAHFNEVFFDNVELASDALIGSEGEGWSQVVAELAFERSGPERIYSSVVLMDAWLTHLRGAGRADAAPLVGRLTAELAILRAMSLACTAALARGESPVTEASVVKDRGTSFEQDLPRAVADDLGAHPDEKVSDKLLRALAYTLHVAPTFSLRGGTREILRGIIARGMGLR